jgi:hypothetical protein
MTRLICELSGGDEMARLPAGSFPPPRDPSHSQGAGGCQSRLISLCLRTEQPSRAPRTNESENSPKEPGAEATKKPRDQPDHENRHRHEAHQQARAHIFASALAAIA